MRPWAYEEALPFIGRFFRPKGGERYVGVLMATQACSGGMALGPSQQLIPFSKLLEEWEWSYLADSFSQWLPCGVSA